MGRAASPFKSDVDALRKEIGRLQKEFSGVERQIASHHRTVEQIQVRRQYLQDLIQVKERMVSRYIRLGRVRAPGVRRPGRPRKAKKTTPPARTRRVPRGRKPAPRGRGKFSNLSVTNATEQILRSAGKPVHLKNVLAEMTAGGKVIRAKKPEMSVRNAIAKDKRFRNVGRNNWTLA